MEWVEKWLKRAIIIQLIFLLAAQILLGFDAIVPYLNKTVSYEGVTHLFQSSARKVIDAVPNVDLAKE
jgi:hypothetical protein